MKQAVIISPLQSTQYNMGRVLLTLAQWNRRYHRPVELDRVMIIDFAVQYPRTFLSLVPEAEYILRSHGFAEADLGDYFVARKFTLIRENFMQVVSSLVAHSLADVSVPKKGDEFVRIALTELGQHTSGEFQTQLSQIIVLLADAYSLAWGSKDLKKLLGEMRRSLPEQSDLVQQLAKPFGSWLED